VKGCRVAKILTKCKISGFFRYDVEMDNAEYGRVSVLCSKNDVISLVRKHYCALGLELKLGLELAKISFPSNVLCSSSSSRIGSKHMTLKIFYHLKSTLARLLHCTTQNYNSDHFNTTKFQHDNEDQRITSRVILVSDTALS